MAETFIVEVCHAAVNHLERVDVRAERGWTIRQVIQASALTGHQALEGENRVGIYGKLKTLDTLVRPGDRIEIYRPLLIAPNAARLRRAEKNRKAGSHAVSKNKV